MTASQAADSPELFIMHEKNQGGAAGPGLKSCSCLIASGTGGRVSLALGLALPRGTGSML